MEKYKKSLILCCVRLTALSFILIATYIVFATSLLHPLFPALSLNYDPDLRDTLLSGVCGFLAVQVVYVISTLRILKNPEKLAAKYRKTGDERRLLIQQKTGSFACIGAMCVLVFAAVVAGAFSSVVCYTLFAVVTLLLVFYFGANLYYSKKY